MSGRCTDSYCDKMWCNKCDGPSQYERKETSKVSPDLSTATKEQLKLELRRRRSQEIKELERAPIVVEIKKLEAKLVELKTKLEKI
jgi:hypothetical protein